MMDQNLILKQLIARLKERLAEVDEGIREIQAYRTEVADDLAQFELVLEEIKRMEAGLYEVGRKAFGGELIRFDKTTHSPSGQLKNT